MRALPERRGNAARQGSSPAAHQRSSPRRSRRGSRFARAHGGQLAHARGARPVAASRSYRAGVLRRDAPPLATDRRRPSPEAVASIGRPRPAAPCRVCRPARRARLARVSHRAGDPPRSGGSGPVSPRARQLPASGVGRGAEAARDRSCLGGPRAGHALARHDHRRIHAAAAQSRSARRGVVGTPPSGARAHALLGRRPQRVARSRSRSRCERARSGEAGPGAAGPGAGGVRRMNILGTVVGTTDVTILVYFLVLNSFYALLLILSIPEIWEQTRLAEDEDFQRLMQSDALPPITILVPAYNESATIEASVTAILTLEYRNYEVVVVNDGSRDDTLEQLRHAFDLYEIPRIYPEMIPTKPLRALYRSRSRSRLLVLDKENGGKADSLNAAINASRFPLVIAVDADTLIEPDALLRLTRPFLLGREIAAVGGTVRVANNCTVKDGRVTDARVSPKPIPGIQVVEYLRAFLFGRLGWNRLGGNLIISGAFGLFRKEYVVAVGGFHTHSHVPDLRP